ncbi:phosphate transport system regulatory protein PhoU [Tessaracoccus lapidicaptus]|uniref:Phosphate-specific transport system accessory protein PhoU n=1 Tax=Tessaracoccus lapidicaptus TaxID=1427523 RepID=A0A1C0ALS7_9ACTN|nr:MULTISPECIES: phosphate signaling complex protein PhoU [Tessaracoccus]AQX15405.1 phosphate transport system regulatory protein PhoU [Tessaracoccus sp. T2.5-30]OCL33774.1 phosphate transport system regulatory protein PhoU [Tessaracoccus lapidicaptus]VEP39704.1 Phosphate-specific transport system accessory protein PhoU [Tessaracoccus lapidicaptus]
MRTSYHEELDSILDRLVHMAELVEVAIREGAESLLTADLTRAESVISNDVQLDKMHEEMEYKCLSLLALQAPVAGELRIIVSAIRVVFELARMGDLAVHVAKIARLRYPNQAVPARFEDSFREMAAIAIEIVRLARVSLQERDAKGAEQLVAIDERMDLLRREQFTMLLGDNSDISIEGAVDVALLGRYFERFADHAVAVGRRVIYIITGQVPEGEDWPNA